MELALVKTSRGESRHFSWKVLNVDDFLSQRVVTDGKSEESRISTYPLRPEPLPCAIVLTEVRLVVSYGVSVHNDITWLVMCIAYVRIILSAKVDS